MIEKC